MPTPRKAQISLDATPYYHCVSRCVRRGFLCGNDKVTNQSYEHRRQWLEDKLLHVSQIFAIDICAYAIMNNHYHVVLHVDEKQAQSWSTEQVLQHYHQQFKGTILTQRYMIPSERLNMSAPEIDMVIATSNTYRKRLYSISWFMKSINEFVAREANKEDECTGHFWEGRFKSQALLDDVAIIACMEYVDLNPIRANIAQTPETSDHTSIKQRIDKIIHQQLVKNDNRSIAQPTRLMPFVGNPREVIPKGIPFNLLDYLELVNDTGKVIRDDKRGYINDDSPILSRLGIEQQHWLTLTTTFEHHFIGAASNETQLITQYKMGVKQSINQIAVNSS